MSKPDDGGPIHPNKGITGITGITRRDDLAKAAMHAHITCTAIIMLSIIIAEDTTKELSEQSEEAMNVCIHKMNPTEIAKSAYMIADAMIAEGNKD